MSDNYPPGYRGEYTDDKYFDDSPTKVSKADKVKHTALVSALKKKIMKPTGTKYGRKVKAGFEKKAAEGLKNQ
jgi:hypothetical protein